MKVYVSAQTLHAPQAFKVKYVTAYLDRLTKLADNDNLRTQLAVFPLSIDASDAVLPEHRPGGCPISAQISGSRLDTPT